MSHALSSAEVDICPCLSITVRDKLHLMETCKTLHKLPEPGCDEYYSGGALYHSGSRGFSKALEHDCTFDSRPFARVQIHTRVWVDEETADLHVHNRYKLELQEERPSASSERKSRCLHENPRDWLRRFFDEAGSNYTGWNSHRSCSFSFDWTEWEKKSFDGCWRGWQGTLIEKGHARLRSLLKGVWWMPHGLTQCGIAIFAADLRSFSQFSYMQVAIKRF